MKIDDTLDHRKPDAVSLRRMRRIALIEFSEDPLSVLDRASGISYSDDNSVFLASYTNAYRAAERREFYRIVKQVEPYLTKKFFASRDEIFVKPELQIKFLFRLFVFPYKYTHPYLLGKVKCRYVGQNRLIFDPCQIQNIRRHLRKPPGFFFNYVEILSSLFGRNIVCFQEFCEPRDRNDRRFEFMRKIVDEIGTEHFRVFEFLCHFIYAVRHLADSLVFRKRAVKHYARAVFAPREAVHHVNYGIYRFHE